MSKGIVLVTFGRLIVKPHILVKDLQLRKCVRYPSWNIIIFQSKNSQERNQNSDKEFHN